jgi:hypothetical protein
MTSRKSITVLDLDGECLTAVQASLSAGRVLVQKYVVASRPQGVAAEDPAAVGAWVRQSLRDAGLDAPSVLLSMSRSDVVLKRLVFPVTGDSIHADDLAGMVRLQMSRALTLAVDGAAIDYAPLSDGSVDGSEGTSAVLAGAMPAERIEWCRKLAREAGVRLSRVTLRSCGAAAMISELSQRRDGPVLGVCLGARTVEFVIVEHGQMVFARAAEFPRPTDEASTEVYAERVAVELRRTWTSYRVGSPGSEAPSVAALGDGPLSRLVGDRCARLLDCQREAVPTSPAIELAAPMPEADSALIVPLLGLLLEEAVGLPALDFAHPRQPSDRKAALRQRVLAGVFAAIVVLGGVGVAGMMKLDSLQAAVNAARVKEAGLKIEMDELNAQQARAGHLEQWTQARVDWLSHLESLSNTLPDPHICQLSELGGALSATVAFNGKSGSSDGTWASSQSGVFAVSGKVKDREIAADLRERLIQSRLYRQVESRGPELSDAFSFELVTSLKQPSDASPAADASGKEPAPAPGAASGKPAATSKGVKK